MSVQDQGKIEDSQPDTLSAELSPSDSSNLEAVADLVSDEPVGADSSVAEAAPVAEIVAEAVAPQTAPAESESESDASDEGAPAKDIVAEEAREAESVAEPVGLASEEGPTEFQAEAVAAVEDIPESAQGADEYAAEPEAEAAASETEETETAPDTPPPPKQEESKYERGQVYPGVISSTTPTAVYVDLGDGDQGLVPGRELELMTRKMLESLVVGATVDVYVVNPRNHRGDTILSINHALEELDWRNAEKLAKSKQVHDALIGGYNKGGLIVRFGRLRGFVPQSQLSEERVRSMGGGTPEERYGPMVNQPIGVKVMEVDRHRNRLILSERAALRDVRQQRKEALIAELKVGDVRKGKVVSLENFGAFVDIGGGEGLVHVSELAWGHITHPRQAVSIGDEVEVEVINVNAAAKRIGLSRKRVISDPWDEIASSLRRGQLVRGHVTKLTKFGAFARLIDHDSVEGLIHISELASERVSHPREVVNRGEELVLRIVKIDIKERRLGLSLKSVNSTEFLDLDWEMALQDSAALSQAPVDAEAADTQAEGED